jgi:hypothetical protein
MGAVSKEARSMSVLAPQFWAWFWAILALGAVAAVALSLVVATAPRPHIHRAHQAGPPRLAAPGRWPHRGHSGHRRPASA